MNKIKIILIGAALFLIAQSVSAAPKNDGRVSVRTKDKNLMVFKTDKDLLGARVEVLYANGDVVSALTLQKRRMIIDFGDVKEGSYTIRLSKGESVHEFNFMKK